MPTILAVDFDGTICNPHDVAEGKRMGNPMPGCKEALDYYRDLNCVIIIHTTRATPDRDMSYLEDWLNYFEIPFDDIAISKPQADYYIDNKGVHFTSWQELRNTLHVI